jgi:putative RNA 2'-phosphotransferase
MKRMNITNNAELKTLSKFLSFVLRHEPGSIGLVLDAAGSASTDELIAKAGAAGKPISREVLHAVVATSDKQRFALSDDGVWLTEHVPARYIKVIA